MRPKSLMLLALALGCGLVASIGISQVMEKRGETIVGYETDSIYVAVVNINLNDPIDETMVALQEWPKDKVPQGAIRTLEELENRRPRTNIIQGEPILEAKLLGQGEIDDPIGKLPPGMRLATISVDAEKSAAGLLSPGDRVDIQVFVNRNPGQGFPNARIRVILQNIRVYAVDRTVVRATDGGEGRTVAKTVSLVVTPSQANKITLAQQIGEVNLIPRSPDDEAITDDVEHNAEELLTGSRNNYNSRKMEQVAGIADQDNEGGLLTGILSHMKKVANERPPFEMTILEAEQVRVVEFDPFSGKLISDTGSTYKDRDSGSTSAAVPTTDAEPEVEDEADEALRELEQELGADFPIDFE